MHFSESMNGWQLICTLCTAEFFLKMFWVILGRQCLLLVQTLCTAEVWKCSGLLCEDRAYCLYKNYAQVNLSGNVLGYSVKTVLTVCVNTMHSLGLEMFWVVL